MNFIKYCLIGLVLITNFNNISFSQKNINYSISLRAPLDIPLILAGNFGELRSNHFHTGIDFKTNRRIGYKVKAIEDGYVSRIRVSPWGYGHVVYIDHPKIGLTSVYAHLKSFNGKIGKLAEVQQRKGESFSFDYYPTKDSIKVKRGEVIALSGNTGSSTAPHLHFEIRETETEEALNPLLFNFNVQDDVRPTIRRVKLYSLTKEGYRVPNKSNVFTVSGGNGNFTINNGKINVPVSYLSQEGGIGFAFDVIDKLNAANNICGVYEAFLLINNDTIFSQQIDRISFHSNRQINTHKDYEEYHRSRRHFHKAFKTKHNSLPIYRKNKNNGIFKALPNNNYSVKYIVKDAYGNTSMLAFEVETENGEMVQEQNLYSAEKTLYPDSAFLSYENSHYIMFPPNILYEPTPLILETSYNSIRFGDDNVPLQSTYKIMLPVHNDFPNQSYIRRTTNKGKQAAEGGTFYEGWITARVRDFGTFSVEIDSIPPSIKFRNFSNNSHFTRKRMDLSIVEEESGLKSYKIFFDDKWHLLSYEPKQRLFYFDVPKDFKGEKKVIIYAEDNVGNVNEKSISLTF
ncbi:MAG: M23 family metallopeptidase [Brumimicrobium sp.]